eukprot:2479980-Pyramimonas_sp.AAC.1
MDMVERAGPTVPTMAAPSTNTSPPLVAGEGGVSLHSKGRPPFGGCLKTLPTKNSLVYMVKFTHRNLLLSAGA